MNKNLIRKRKSKLNTLTKCLSLVFILFLNIYSINGQTWDTKDLLETTFRNGDTLFHAQTDEQWQLAAEKGIPAYCYYENDKSKGILYNWFAVTDKRRITRLGWRIPSYSELNGLILTESDLRANDNSWQESNVKSNSFNARANGYRDFGEVNFHPFTAAGFEARYWSLTEDENDVRKKYALTIYQGNYQPTVKTYSRSCGFSVRCIRDKNEIIKPSLISATKQFIRIGKSTTLSMSGGDLSVGAEWVWTENKCLDEGGVEVGRGRKLTIEPKSTTIYFLTAINADREIECIEMEVFVDDGSLPPNSIQGSNSICKGESLSLRLNGGELSPNSRWVWYENFEGGNDQPIGFGETITIEPKTTSTYSVRSESSEETTDFVQHKVLVREPPNKPKKINGAETYCEGSKLNLAVIGRLNPDDKYVWQIDGQRITEPINNRSLNKESLVSVYAYNRSCGSSDPIYKKITIERRSTDGETQVIYPEYGRKVKVIQQGGHLGDGAKWFFYDNNNLSRPLKSGGNGVELTLKAKNAKTLLLRAEQKGYCNYKSPGNRTQILGNLEYWSDYHSETNGNLHWGYDFGVNAVSAGDSLFRQDSTYSMNTLWIGLKAAMYIHFPIKEMFSFGFRAGYSYHLGLLNTVDGNDNFDTENDLTYSYTPSNFSLGSEVLFGITNEGKAKLLIDYGISYFMNNLIMKDNSSTTVYSNTLNHRWEIISAGFRFGKYGQFDKSSQFDLLFSVSKRNNIEMFSPGIGGFLTGKDNFGKWNPGFKLKYWKHGNTKVELEAILNIENNRLGKESIDFSKSFVQFTWVYSFDKFSKARNEY